MYNLLVDLVVFNLQFCSLLASAIDVAIDFLPNRTKSHREDKHVQTKKSR